MTQRRTSRDTTATGGDEEIRERGRRVREMFSAIVPVYDLLNRVLSLWVDCWWRRRTVRWSLAALRSGESGGRRVLDLCTGTGDLGLAYARRLSAGDLVVGADFSHAMLVAAKSKAGDALRLAEGDALRLPFVDGAFDLTAVAFGLRNFADRRAGLREMARVTARGGQVVVLEFSQPRAWWLRPFHPLYVRRLVPRIGDLVSRTHAYTYLAESIDWFAEPDEVRGWMEEAGMIDVRYETLTGGIAVVHRGEAA